MILRTICAVTTAVMIGMMMSGCADSSDNSSATDKNSSAVLSQSADETLTAKSVLEQLGDDNLDASAFIGDEVFKANSSKLYGVTQDNFADAGIIYSGSGGLADEVSMLKNADGTSAESILEKRLESRSTVFENYKPEEMDKLNAAEIFQAGDYWVLVISDNLETIKDKITELTK